MTRPHGPDTYQRGSALSRGFLPLALITLGVVVLLSNVLSDLIPDRGRGGLIVFGLGAAFGVGRVTTGRYGYAVPAGLLMALGLHIIVQSLELARGLSSQGTFFMLMGVGFALVYLIGMRPVAVWPLFLAAILVALGVALLGVASLGPLASLSWIAAYWPAALVVLGAWLLLHDAVPVPIRRPVATLGGMVLLAYGVVAAAASVAAGGALAQTGVGPAFGSSPFSDTLDLEQPIASGQTFTVTNSSGTTTITGGSDSSVHVTATRHFAVGGQPPDVKLVGTGNGVSLASSASGRGRFPFGGDSSSVDYAIEVPDGVAVIAQGNSGSLRIDDVSGPVTASTTSGHLTLSNLAGAVQAQASSGSIDLTNIGGDVRATASSGKIVGTQLQHVRQVSTSSGSISLEGTFTDAAQISASSGTVNLKLLPGSAINLDVHTNSGSVQPQGLVLNGGVTRRDTLTGAIGSPSADAVLHVQTTSGSVLIGQ
jgi:hypothetical protein